MNPSKSISILAACLILLLFFQGTKKTVIKAPPGTVQLSEKLFIDQRPTTVMDYRVIEYFSLIVNLDCYADSIGEKWTSNEMLPPGYHEELRDVCASDSVEVSHTFLDREFLSTKKPIAYKEPMGHAFDSYYKHPAYADYPLIGVRFDQAKAYCAWRTNAVKQGMMIDGSLPSTLPYKDFTYRLPTKAEWLQAQDAFTKSKFVAEQTTVDAAIIQWVDLKGKKDYIGFSNISEMVAEEGVALGRNWKMEDENVLSEFEYSEKAEWLGFRCVCEFEM